MRHSEAKSLGGLEVDRQFMIPTDAATDWMTANWPIPAAVPASRITSACVTLGAGPLPLAYARSLQNLRLDTLGIFALDGVATPLK